MSPKAKKLDDVEMKNFAAYYAGLDPKPVNIPKPLSPDDWAEKCDRCHGVNGNSARPEVPALAAQRQDYLEAALRKYQSGARKSPEMAAMSSVLTEDDVIGIAAHYAHQKPRAAIFVTCRASEGLGGRSVFRSRTERDCALMKRTRSTSGVTDRSAVFVRGATSVRANAIDGSIMNDKRLPTDFIATIPNCPTACACCSPACC